MKKSINTLFVALTLGLACTCSKFDEGGGAGEQKVAWFSLGNCSGEGNADVKSTISGASVKWATADVIQYYTGKATAYRSGVNRYVVSDKTPPATVSLPVTYTDGDVNVVFFVTGNRVGDYSGTPTFSQLKITGGVPAEQDGTFGCAHIGVAKATLTSNTPAVTNKATLSPLQGYIKFKMSKLIFADTDVKKIEITAAGNTNAGNTYICGDITISNPGNGNTIAYGSGTKVTINKSSSEFTAGVEYYVALNAVTYSNGLTFTMYDDASNELGKVKVTGGAGLKVEKGKILDIGDIQGKKSVKLESVTIYPTFSRVSTTYKLGKKFWLRVLPEDYTGTISVTKTGVDCMSVTQVADETLPGIGLCKCFQASVTSSSYTNYTERNCTLTFHFPLPSPYTGTETTVQRVVELGVDVDLGLKAENGKRLLYAKTDMAGDGPTSDKFKLANDMDYPGVYLWGNRWRYKMKCKTGNKTKDGYPGEGNAYAEYDAWNGNKFLDVEQKYKAANNVNVLQTYVGQYDGKLSDPSTMDRVDDIAHIWNANYWTPSVYDCAQLLSNATLEDGATNNYGKLSKNYKSNVVGYTDMYIVLQPGTASSKNDVVWGDLNYTNDCEVNGGYAFLTNQKSVGYDQSFYRFVAGNPGSIGLNNAWAQLRAIAVRPVRYKD